MHQALADRRRGPGRPYNRLAVAREHAVATLCHDRSTWSSYQVQSRGGPSMPSPRTIQRVRKRHGLARLPKRVPAVLPNRRLDPVTRSRANAIIREKPYLGPERMAWDLRNDEHLRVSPSTMKRLKRQYHQAMVPPRPPAPTWHFYERRHQHSLWHGDFLEKVTLTDSTMAAVQGLSAFSLLRQYRYPAHPCFRLSPADQRQAGAGVSG